SGNCWPTSGDDALQDQRRPEAFAQAGAGDPIAAHAIEAEAQQTPEVRRVRQGVRPGVGDPVVEIDLQYAQPRQRLATRQRPRPGVGDVGVVQVQLTYPRHPRGAEERGEAGVADLVAPQAQADDLTQVRRTGQGGSRLAAHADAV